MTNFVPFDWRPEDLATIRTLEGPRLSPSADEVVFSVVRADVESDRYLSDIVTVRLDGAGSPRRYTTGYRDMAPAWSPDGESIAFVRFVGTPDGRQGKGQIWLLSLLSGETEQLTDLPLGVESFAWSPDGREIAFVARVPEADRYGTDPSVPEHGELPRRITSLQYRYDGVGYTFDKRRHIFVLHLGDERSERVRIRQLTSGDFDNWAPCWCPDGSQLVFLSVRHIDREARIAQDIFIMDRNGSNVAQLTDTNLCIFRPTFSPDGTHIYFIAHEIGSNGIDVVQRYAGLWSVPLDCSRDAVRLTDEEQVHLNERYNARGNATTRPLTWHDGAVLAERPNRGTVELVRVDTDGTITTLVSGRRQVRGFDAGRDVIVCNVVSDTSWGELVCIVKGSERTVWTPLSSGKASKTIAPMEPVEAVSNDGYPVHGWIVRPSGDGPHPALLMIHGGPFYQHGWACSDEVQTYVAAGYAVLLANPRGSLGYGQSHSRSVIGKIFTCDVDDLLAFLEQAVRDQSLDSARVGVLGVSYGGAMTSWLIGHTDRFEAAVSECAVNDWESFRLTADIGYYFAQAYTTENAERMRAKSPLTYASQVTTPTLVIQSELDWCCTMEQGQKFYASLKQNAVAAEMLIFPGEGHMLFESGRPKHRVARLQAILDWFARYL